MHLSTLIFCLVNFVHDNASTALATDRVHFAFSNHVILLISSRHGQAELQVQTESIRYLQESLHVQHGARFVIPLIIVNPVFCHRSRGSIAFCLRT